MKHFTVIFLFCCIAVAKAGNTGSNSNINVEFKLRRHDHFNNPHQLKFNSTINPDWVNKQWKTVIFIHGWIEGHRMAEIMQNAYLSGRDQNVNIIEVDWLSGTYNPAYFSSANHVPSVGEIVAKFIGLNQEKFNLTELVIVGHSLGAHAAGFVGKALQSNYNLKPRLIVGLDPAGPLFHSTNAKLQPNDAQCVLVIHTSEILGHLEPLGTTDVYINGGKAQPGCSAAQSHSFARIFYRELVNGNEPLVGHLYSSFDEVETDIVPKTKEVELFHGAPCSIHGSLIYVDTKKQPHLFFEVRKYIDADISSITDSCNIL